MADDIKEKGKGILSMATTGFKVVAIGTFALSIAGAGAGVFAPAAMGAENLLDIFADAAAETPIIDTPTPSLDAPSDLLTMPDTDVATDATTPFDYSL